MFFLPAEGGSPFIVLLLLGGLGGGDVGGNGGRRLGSRMKCIVEIFADASYSCLLYLTFIKVI